MKRIDILIPYIFKNWKKILQKYTILIQLINYNANLK